MSPLALQGFEEQRGLVRLGLLSLGCIDQDWEEADERTGKAKIMLCRKNCEIGFREKKEDVYALETYFGGRIKLHCRIGPT